MRDHRITRSLGRTAHVLHFLDGGDLRYACDHLGRLTELASLALRCAAPPPRTAPWSSTRSHQRTPRGERGSGTAPSRRALAHRAAGVNHAGKGCRGLQPFPRVPREAASAFARNAPTGALPATPARNP